MATKRKAIAVLKELHPDARLDHDDSIEWATSLVAPDGYFWPDANCHLVPVEWYKGTTPKSEYWQEVIDAITGLGTPCRCTAETCPAWDMDVSAPNQCACSI